MTFFEPQSFLGFTTRRQRGRETGMCSAADRSRLVPLLRRAKRLGYCADDVPTVADLFDRCGELWSTNGLELHVSLDPLTCTFLAYYISALRGCCALKFLHALDNDLMPCRTLSWLWR